MMRQRQIFHFLARQFLWAMSFCSALLVWLQISAGELGAQETTKIRLGYSALSFSFLPHLIARDAGVFRKHGLDVDLIQIAGPLQVAALTAGELDFGGAVSPALFAAVRGLPLRGLMIAVKTPLFYIVSDPSIQKIEELAGKRLAVDTVGALQHIAARAMLKKKGVNPDQISYAQTGSVSNSLAALSGKTVSAAVLSLPNNVTMTQKGYHELASTQEAGVHFPPSGLTIHLAKLQKDRGQIRRVLSAVLDASEYIEREREWVTSYVQRVWRLTPKVADEVYRLVLPTLALNGKMSLEDVQAFLDVAQENNLIAKKADSRALMEYAPLDELLKDNRTR